MKQLILVPDGWPCSLDECPPGLFVWNDHIGFKTSYKADDDAMEVYSASGDAFWYGGRNYSERSKIIVQPVSAEWIDDE